MEIFTVKDLSFSYPETNNKALDDISFSMSKGEFITLCGFSGSGKSTLMHMLGGVDRPTQGRIIIDGTEINRMNSNKLAIFRRRQIGLVYQFYNLIPILTVEENITLPADLDGKKISEEKLDGILDTLGIKNKRRNLPNELSGGQQQRVSIARALINEPAILLADEPTGNLDSKATEDIMGLLKMTNKKYKQTIIMITHNLDIARTADRILTIRDGKIVEEV